MTRDPAELLPLKPVDLQLLLALADGELHGYGLVLAIERATDGLLPLDPGHLDRVSQRLLDEGVVAESPARRASPGEERRRYYEITPLGRRVLVAELRRLQSLVASPAVRALVEGWAR